MSKKITIPVVAISCILVAAAFTLSLSLKGTMDGMRGSYGSEISQLQKENSTLQSQLSSAQQQESKDVANLNGKLGTLSSPTDPLSAYNQICNQQMQNSNTGSDQTFYWPCTDSAQTTPQPGNL